MFVAPAQRTRIPSSGNDVLIQPNCSPVAALTPPVVPFILLGKMWGYAEGNPTLVGIVVIIITGAAIGYVARRLWKKGR